jgi:hypothetical protein
MAKNASRGRQDVGNILNGVQVVQNQKQLKNQQQQMALQTAQLTQAQRAEKAAHERWYFALPAHKQAEYDLVIARRDLNQAQSVIPALEAEAARLATPRDWAWNVTWLTVLGGLGLVLLVLGVAAGSAGAIVFGLAGVAGGAWMWFMAPRTRSTKARSAQQAVAHQYAYVGSIARYIAEVEPRAVDPFFGPRQG